MLGKKLILPLLLLAPLVIAQISVSPCPILNHNGSVISATIIISSNGIVPLVDAQDSQCYNYSLPYSFTNVPQVAVGVHDFQSQSSNNLFYFIKPLQSNSLAFVPFVIRTQWAYTRWSRISFSFIVEDREDFQSGYYQIDSGLLAGCASGKEIRVLLPFSSAFVPGININHNIFLHGYQISTMPSSQNQRSPYELQLTASSANVSGIAVTLSVTTITQVNSIYVSYIAYQSTNLKVIEGFFVYDVKDGKGFTSSPSPPIPRNYARIYGITGFIINYNRQNIYFGTQWTGFEFRFHLGPNEPLTNYLTYQYLFFIGSECEDCPGYPISYNGSCVNVCPVNTFQTPQNVCLSCGEGRFWNGTACVIRCPKGQYLNPLSNRCECPPTLNWNGERCIPCTSGKVFMPETRSCECPPPLKWNGFGCAKLVDCSNGTVWNVYTYRCQCPEHQYWSVSKKYCLDIPQCTGGRVLDASYRCVCPQNYNWNHERFRCEFYNCLPGSGQVLIGNQCGCPAGRNWNGSKCLQCINGQIWVKSSLSCECPNGYEWTGILCNRTYNCTGNRVWNATLQQCICPSTQYWNGRQCTIKPECSGGRILNLYTYECECRKGWNWDTKNCVYCQSGQIWDEPNLQCLCPRGTVWDDVNKTCRAVQNCRNGQTWNPNLWRCQCPANTYYNGLYCIANPCQNGRIWNDTIKRCVCPDNKIWDSRSCVPPRIDCTNGRIWDPSIYACSCPVGTFPNINKCDPIPVCINGQTYNPLSNECQCPYSMIYQNGRCIEPSCPNNQYWNGYQCVMINCPPGSYYKDHKCVFEPEPQDQCKHSEYWNGQSCRYYQLICPFGTIWDSQTCRPIGSCPSGHYNNSKGLCEPIPQECVPPTYWENNRCQAKNGNCPNGSYYSGGTCKKSIPCQSGHVWDPIYLRCTCPSGQQSNGHVCIQCSGGKEWVPGVGCRCKTGDFDFGSSCQKVDESRCSGVPNAKWLNGLCQCNSGYTKIGLQCVCYGVEASGVCDRCSQKPNSEWHEYFCKCLNGYTEINGVCTSNSNTNQGNDNPSSCAVGSYFDNNHRKCIACSDGCLSCVDSYTCTLCRPEFLYHHGLCLERCGDGFKFVLGCDDGNNEDGDGCSRDCKVEEGYVCQGGSPDTADKCITFQKNHVTISLSGQIRKPTSVILNVRLDYMPKTLLKSVDCSNKCLNVLVGEIIQGDMSSTSIVSQYSPGTSYSFAVQIEFDRPYIGKFKVKISVDKAIGLKYFSPISTASPLEVQVQPSYLAVVENNDELK